MCVCVCGGGGGGGGGIPYLMTCRMTVMISTCWCCANASGETCSEGSWYCVKAHGEAFSEASVEGS